MDLVVQILLVETEVAFAFDINVVVVDVTTMMMMMVGSCGGVVSARLLCIGKDGVCGMAVLYNRFARI